MAIAKMTVIATHSVTFERLRARASSAVGPVGVGGRGGPGMGAGVGMTCGTEPPLLCGAIGEALGSGVRNATLLTLLAVGEPARLPAPPGSGGGGMAGELVVPGLRIGPLAGEPARVFTGPLPRFPLLRCGMGGG